MQGRLFSGTFWAATYEPLDRLVVFERTTTRIDTSASVHADVAALGAALAAVDRRRAAALLDLRNGYADPHADADELWSRSQPTFAGFRRYAIVVRTEVGKLQVKRLAGATRSVPLGVFFDLAEARLFCRAPG